MTQESKPSTEQLALIGFAARLGTSSSSSDCITNADGSVRQEAQLLMNLMVSLPPTIVVPCSPTESLDSCTSQGDEKTETVLGNEKISHNNSDNTFVFCCPSLSLENATAAPPPPPPQKPVRRVSDSSQEEDDDLPSATFLPASLLRRELSVDRRDAMPLSATAMARNVLQSFQKALEWRVNSWVLSLSQTLFQQEAELKAQETGATEEEVRHLLKTPEARIVAILKQINLKVLDARTSFRVLSEHGDSTTQPPPKKRKVSSNYTKTHALSLQTVLNLDTPAGFTEVTLEAPGIMKGIFQGHNAELVGASVELDTVALSAMMEKSSRIVVRSALEECLRLVAEMDEEQEEQHEQEQLVATPFAPTPPLEDYLSSPKATATVDDCTAADGNQAAPAAVVTPRYRSPPPYHGDSDLEVPDIPLPSDFSDCNKDNADDGLRMVSPQPRSPPLLGFAPRSTESEIMVPSLVSPSPATKTLKQSTEPMTPLPMLVDVVCNAMRATID